MIKLEAGTKRLVPIWGHSEISNLEFDWDHNGSTEISHIYISHDNHIRFIQFQYVEENGVLSKLSPMPVKNPYGWRFNVVSLSLLTLYMLYIALNFDQSSLLLKFYLLTLRCIMLVC
jgi:hypothetical protein